MMNGSAAARPARKFYNSKEWWAGLAGLVTGVVSIASGEVPLGIDALQGLWPQAVLVFMGLKSMFNSSGRTRIEQQLQERAEFLAEITQTRTRPSPAPDEVIEVGVRTIGAEDVIEHLRAIRDLSGEVVEKGGAAADVLERLRASERGQNAEPSPPAAG